jgi:hypothetical protein
VYVQVRKSSAQSTYRGRVEIGEVYLPSQLELTLRAGVHPSPTQGWADFSIMMEGTPESGHCECSAYNGVGPLLSQIENLCPRVHIG